MINHWRDFYRQLWLQAARTRGTVVAEQADAQADRYQTIPEWPRTTYDDVAAIVMVVGPILEDAPVHAGGYGITRLWHTAVIELEALTAFHHGHLGEYGHNRSFWSVLLAVATYLETIEAPVPTPDAWDVLRAELAVRPAARNADGVSAIGRPIGSAANTPYTIAAATFPAMWDAQVAAMAKARGFDDARAPQADSSGSLNVPRTTNADVIRLADYWGKALVQLQVKVMTGGVTSPPAFEAEQTRWQTISADVDRYAKTGKTSDPYSHNEELWRATRSLAAALAALGTTPSPYTLEASPSPAPSMSGVEEAAEKVVHAIGSIAHEASAGLMSAVGKPILIGGGVLLGLYLLLRRGDDREGR